MKKAFFICALLIYGLLIFNQQQSRAEKMSHKDFAKMELKDCNSCHKEQGIPLTHDNDWAGRHHQNTDWMGEHRALAGKAGTNCIECHTQSFCNDCHTGGGVDAALRTPNFKRNYMPKNHRSDFISIHPIKAKDNQQSCIRCHNQKFCSDCHARFPKGSLRIKSHNPAGPNNQIYAASNWSIDHSTEARRNLQSCQTCHPSGDVCIKCHSSGKTRPHPRNWKAGNFKDRTNGKVCVKCHLPGTY